MLFLLLTTLTLLYTQVGLTQEVILNVDNHSFKGDKNAKVTLIEFADYQCLFCGRHFRETEPQIERDYVKIGKVKFIFWDFPLKSHKDAFKAAEATHCARDQGKYWEMHDRLFANQGSLDLRSLSQHARAIGLNLQSFQLCLDNGKYTADIRRHMEEATKLGVKVTPTFFLGPTEADIPKVKIQKTIVGAKPYTSFKETIDSFFGVQNKG